MNDVAVSRHLSPAGAQQLCVLGSNLGALHFPQPFTTSSLPAPVRRVGELRGLLQVPAHRPGQVRGDAGSRLDRIDVPVHFDCAECSVHGGLFELEEFV